MFTGLIEHVGAVTAVVGHDPVQVHVTCPAEWGALARGASVAIDGVCLTVVTSSVGNFTVEAGKETLRRTTLGAIRPRAAVNLERPLRLGDRLDGHLVLGHVDGVGTVTNLVPEGATVYLTVRLPASLRPFVASQGSLALAGISLTIAGIGPSDDEVRLALIPHTLEATSLRGLCAGAQLNVEVDVLARYAVRALSVGVPGPAHIGTPGALTVDFLRERGFA